VQRSSRVAMVGMRWDCRRNGSHDLLCVKQVDSLIDC
jgi:hypothetical protein